MNDAREIRTQQILFDPTPEIYATDSAGAFVWPLVASGEPWCDIDAYDEVRFVFSVWHPAGNKMIDLDRAYVELQAALDSEEDHWIRLAEIEPVVAPYGAGETFDGWIVLPVLGTKSAFALVGSGLEPRTRLQVRASAYFVA
jgi:hypothetical protein